MRYKVSWFWLFIPLFQLFITSFQLEGTETSCSIMQWLCVMCSEQDPAKKKTYLQHSTQALIFQKNISSNWQEHRTSHVVAPVTHCSDPAICPPLQTENKDETFLKANPLSCVCKIHSACFLLVLCKWHAIWVGH